VGVAAGAQPAVPKAPAPVLKGFTMTPPPAWVTTARGERWLGYSSFCWVSVADFVGETTKVCGRPHGRPPRIPVRRGQLVHFELGFQPQRVVISIGRRRFVLPAAERTTWRVAALGVALLQAKTGVGYAGYTARFVAG